MKTKILILIAAFFVFSVGSVQAAPLKVCIKANGSFVAKRRCAAKKGQTEVSISTLGTQGVQGPAGPKGDKGDAGSQGPQGEAGQGFEGLEIVMDSNSNAAIPNNGWLAAVAVCPAGKQVVMGGCDDSSGQLTAYGIGASAGLTFRGNHFRCNERNETAGNVSATLTATALCMPFPSL